MFFGCFFFSYPEHESFSTIKEYFFTIIITPPAYLPLSFFGDPFWVFSNLQKLQGKKPLTAKEAQASAK